MSHNIEHYNYKENCNRNVVLAELSNYVSHATWQEGGGGIDHIDWHEKPILDSYDEAEDFIKEYENKRGLWYYCGAVRYRNYSNIKPTKKYLELEEREKRLFKSYQDKRNNLHYKGVKSSFVGCKNCGSKLATAYINSNFCPMCNADLRPASTITAIQNAKKAYESCKKELAKEKAKMQAKQRAKAEIRWLVKIEYHT